MHNTVGKSPGLLLLVRALCVYALSAFLLLAISSCFLAHSDVGSHVLGYFSSVISFLSAFVSTRLLLRSQKSLSLFSVVIFAGLLVIILLTIGFLAGDRALDPSGVLSVVSFSFAGVSLGGILPLRISSRKPPRGRRVFS